MNILNDNTIIPSYLGVQDVGISSGNDDMLTNYVLRYGEIRAVNYPGDDNNYTGNQIEYTVEVQHRDGGGISASTLYRGVTVNNLFGGIADRVEMTYRTDTQKSQDGIGNGSKVLVLCISGDQAKAVILGGVSTRAEKSKNEGHNLFFEFNGSQFTVNKDGEAQFLHRGATDADGNVKDELKDFSDSLVKFDKDGNITVKTPNGKQLFELNNKTGTAEIQAENKISVHTGGEVTLHSDQTFSIESQNDSIKMNAGQGVKVGLATDKWVKGTTYRMAEGTMNKTLAGSMSSAATILATSSATLITAAGMNAIPMVGGILALPGLMAVAGQLAALGGIFGAMSGAINGFEAGSETFLSQKNTTD